MKQIETTKYKVFNFIFSSTLFEKNLWIAKTATNGIQNSNIIWIEETALNLS